MIVSYPMKVFTMDIFLSELVIFDVNSVGKNSVGNI